MEAKGLHCVKRLVLNSHQPFTCRIYLVRKGYDDYVHYYVMCKIYVAIGSRISMVLLAVGDMLLIPGWPGSFSVVYFLSK